MILRRVIGHFRKQEWTAIALDFLIVVIGVVVGIQVSNWNAERIDQSRALSFLERIGNDLDSDLLDLESRLGFWRQVADYGGQGLSYAEAPEAGTISQWELVLAYFQASQVAELIPSQATYDELKGAGELRLISNLELRNSLTRYYIFAAGPTINERPPYRQNVRGLIPIDVQNYIWDSCFATTGSSNQEMFPCPSPIDEQRATAIVNRIISNEALMAELRYWMSTLHVSNLIGLGRQGDANALRELVNDEISKH